MSIPELHQFFLNSSGVSTDTRSISDGQIFFALSGGNFNGNEFAAQALSSGASFAVIDQEDYLPQGDSRYVLVEDSLQCLQELSAHHRRQFDIPFIGITGSNGKTTTKELLLAVLREKYQVQATVGNFNNHIGIPLTLLSMPLSLDIAIVEMGANRQGDIAGYCEYAMPTHGLITNIGAAHLEGFGGLEGVLKGKTELYRYLAEGKGEVFVRSADEKLMNASEGFGDKRHTYGSQQDQVSGKADSSNGELRIEMRLGSKTYDLKTAVFGDYNLDNFMSAAAIGLHFGVEADAIYRALASYEPDNNRSQIAEWKGHTVVMDAYNANPTSVDAAVRSFLSSGRSPSLVILGEMNELGADTESGHRSVVENCMKLKADRILLVGQKFKDIAAENGLDWFADVAELGKWFNNAGLSPHHILLKGSRTNRLEDLVE